MAPPEQASQSFFERVHRAYGKAVSRCPRRVYHASCAIYMILAIPWIPHVRKALGIDLGKSLLQSMSDADFEEAWSTDEGNIVDTVRNFKSLRNRDWEYSLQLTMFVGKGALKGEDILTPEVFDEISPLLKSFHNIKVRTSSGKTYTTWDLCARGAVPDKPEFPHVCALWEQNKSNTDLYFGCVASGTVGGMPYMPCLISAPQACFSEFADQALHESYKVLDPVIDQVMPPSVAAKPWTGPNGRPSYRTLSAAGMKEEVSTLRHMTNQRGCNAYTQLATFTPDVWGGRVRWNANKTRVEKVPAFMWSLFLDGPARTAFRMSLADTAKAEMAEIAEAVDLLEDVWQLEVDAFTRKSTLVEAVNMQWPSTFEEIEDQYADPPWGRVILGYVLMAFFIVFTLASCEKRLRYRWMVGLAGLCAVGSALGGGLGLFLILGWQANAVTFAVLPFFGLGLGVNDMFVLINHFSELSQLSNPDGTPFHSAEGITCEMLAGAGPGAFLTSLCNCISLLFGAFLLPVPALAEFCISAAFVVMLNYIAILTQIVPLLSYAASLSSVPSNSCADSILTLLCGWMQSIRSPVTWKQLEIKLGGASTPRFCAGSSVLWCTSLVLLVISGFLIDGKEIGYDPAEVVKRGTPQYRPVEVFFVEFNAFPAYLCFKDVDVPNEQLAMLDLLSALTGPDQKHAEPLGLNYLTAFYYHLASRGQMGNFAGRKTALAPFGALNLSSDAFWEQYHDWSYVPVTTPTEALDPANLGFLTADFAMANEFTFVSNNRSLSPPLRFSFFSFYIVGLDDQRDFVESIKEANAVMDKSPLKGKAAIYGATFTFWSVLLDLDGTMTRMLGWCLGGVFASTLVCSLLSSSTLPRRRNCCGVGVELLVCVSIASVSTLACALIVGEIYGLSMVFLKFNMFVAMTLLAASGMSIEFVAHQVTAFIQASGSPQERVARALAVTSPAIMQSTFSTVIAILPMALSPFTFMVKYCFGMFGLVQATGLVNGLIFLPAFLGAVGFIFQREADLPTEGAISAHTVGSTMPTVLTSKQSNAGKTDEAGCAAYGCQTVRV